MPDKKLTDAEIAKDLECYRGQKLFAFNGKRPEIYIHDIIDLINRQKAEIERLERIVKHTANGSARILEMANESRIEAYKEFAERLKEKYGYYDWENKTIVYPEDEIDNLLKELVGETDGSK